MSNNSQLIKIFNNNPGGCSIKCVGTTTTTNYSLANYKTGYFVALTDNPTTTPNRHIIVAGIHQTAKRLNIRKYFIGYWKDQKTNLEYIDLAIHVRTQKEAKKIGYQYNQKAIFSCKRLDSIYLLG